MTNISIADAGLAALMGYVTVFIGLILLMFLVMIIGKFFTASAKKTAPAAVPVPAASAATAPGAAGSVKLNGVEPKTAAMAMAIVADTMGKPINELRFISIREVSE